MPKNGVRIRPVRWKCVHTRSVLGKMNSFEGVKSADGYILTKWQYYDDWIIREIDERLLLPPLSRKSEKGSRQYASPELT